MKVKLLLFMLLSCATSAAQCGIDEGWAFYQEDGKWGVLYKGEPCLLPRFDGVSGIVEYGRFAYKENNQYGISTVWKKVTEPFCDSLVWVHNADDSRTFGDIVKLPRTFAIFKKNGKWGVCSTDGTIVLAPAYQNIYETFYDFRVFGIPYSKFWKKIFLNNICYFLVNDGASNKMIDVLGNTVIPDIGNFEDFICADGKGNPTLIKSAKKKEWSREDNEDEFKRLNDIIKKVDSANAATSLYGDWQAWDDTSNDSAERWQEMKKPRTLYFGSETKAFGDTAVVNGFESIVNSYGFISTPLMYNSPYFKLKNNPSDVLSLLYIIDLEGYRYYSRFGKTNKIYIPDEDVLNGKVEEDISIMSKRLVDYQGLIDMANELQDTLARSVVQKKYDKLRTDLEDLKLAYKKDVKRLNQIAKIDRFANVATSVLNSVASAIGGTSTNTSSSSTTTGTSSISIGTNSTKQDSQMSMSDQVNYNSLRNTYNKWASDLMQMKNANGKYQNGFKASDKKHAQDEMKRIRKSAMQKWKKEIPYNSIEDW